jgi:hypothetical protein
MRDPKSRGVMANKAVRSLKPLHKGLAHFTLYINPMIVFNASMSQGCTGEGESVFHLMPMSMFRRLDPLPHKPCPENRTVSEASFVEELVCARSIRTRPHPIAIMDDKEARQ